MKKNVLIVAGTLGLFLTSCFSGNTPNGNVNGNNVNEEISSSLGNTFSSDAQSSQMATASEAETVQEQSDTKGSYTVNGVTFKMITVEGGTFTMGASTPTKETKENEFPAHSVTLNTFQIGETEVTQELWEAVMATNPSVEKDPKMPVGYVTDLQCIEFVEKLNQMTGEHFRLPSEAEWEYAAKGGNMGKNTLYAGDDNFKNVCWCSDNAKHVVRPVATKQPNELGIYDMSGNVAEFCIDYFDAKYYESSPSENPVCTKKASHRVVRGGACSNDKRYCRVTARSSAYVNNRFTTTGFRLAK